MAVTTTTQGSTDTEAHTTETTDAHPFEDVLSHGTQKDSHIEFDGELVTVKEATRAGIKTRSGRLLNAVEKDTEEGRVLELTLTNSKTRTASQILVRYNLETGEGTVLFPISPVSDTKLVGGDLHKFTMH